MSTPTDVLIASFETLEPGLQRNITVYLATGKSSGFLSKLTKQQRDAVSDLPENARADFYRVMDHADNGLLLRLGRVISSGSRWRPLPPELVPEALWAMLDDACRTLFGRAGVAPEFTVMSIERLQTLLEMEGVRRHDIAGRVIDLLVGTSYGSLDYAPRGLQTIPGIAEFLVAHRDDLYECTHRFREGAHSEVLRLASTHPPLAERIAELLVAYTTDHDKRHRAAALAVVATLPVALQVPLLEQRLAVSSSATHRTRVIASVERIPDAGAAIGVLERALATAKGAAAAELDRAIQRLAIYAFSDAPVNTATMPLVRLDEHRLDDRAVSSMRAALIEFAARNERALAALREAREKSMRENPEVYHGNEVEWTESLGRTAELALAELPRIVGYLSGQSPHPGDAVLQLLVWPGIRERLLGLEPANWARLSVRLEATFGAGIIGQEHVPDARATVDVLVRAGLGQEEAEWAILESFFTNPWEVPTLRPDQMVPLMADRPRVFDVVFGLAVGETPAKGSDQRHRVLEILEVAPAIPQRYLPAVTELAIGGSKAHRAAAQRVLERHGLARRMAEEALRAKSPNARAAAVLWLEALGAADVVGVLDAHLEREKSTPVRAATIATLGRLGRDVRTYLRQDILESEAVAGLGKNSPVGLRWFPFEELPACRYDDGSAVPSIVVRWWVTLAFTLKDPLGAGLLPLYLKTLDATDAAALGRFVLLRWIARDSAPHDDAAVMLRAMIAVAKYERDVQAAGMQPDIVEIFDVFEDKREELSAATPSAIADKGILAVASRLHGAELDQIVRQFMRRHPLKRAQIDALLHVLSLSEHAEPLQLLVATARRHRTAGLQETARVLVGQVAERRGWTVDQLADRMVPTIGLDQNRALCFDYGPRAFVGRVGAGLVIELETHDGAKVRSLPTPRVDDVNAADAKAAFTSARKELAAVVTAQRRRLYDAMCLRREWTGAEWRELLLAHPILGVFAAGLVWHLDDELVRPDLTGNVLTFDGTALEVAPDAVISIAHPTTMEPAAIERWRAVPSDIVVGFDPFRARPIAVSDTESQLDSLDGGASESFTLRSRLAKLEWVRGATEDGARFAEYTKSVGASGFRGVISFSGSSLPETSIPIELGVLTVLRGAAPCRFAEVPPALLAELVADYLSLQNEAG
jgi:hypothetical protein